MVNPWLLKIYTIEYRYIYYFNALLLKEFRWVINIYTLFKWVFKCFFKQGDYKVKKKQVIKDKFVRENAANVL